MADHKFTKVFFAVELGGQAFGVELGTPSCYNCFNARPNCRQTAACRSAHCRTSVLSKPFSRRLINTKRRGQRYVVLYADNSR